ncbi:flagella basal body P-ring formation protein FlgA [archaeon]|nr:flagella basal body P-ring formation protein FlgA [archaeon]
MILVRIASFFKFYILLVALLFIIYSSFDLGTGREILLFIGATMFSPYLFKEALRVKGVKKGDTVLVSFRKDGPFGEFVQKVPGRALSGGRRGGTIEVEYGGTIAKGEILGYGGIIFPPEVNLLYYEEETLKKEIR